MTQTMYPTSYLSTRSEARRALLDLNNLYAIRRLVVSIIPFGLVCVIAVFAFQSTVFVGQTTASVQVGDHGIDDVAKRIERGQGVDYRDITAWIYEHSGNVAKVDPIHIGDTLIVPVSVHRGILPVWVYFLFGGLSVVGVTITFVSWLRFRSRILAVRIPTREVKS